MKRLCGHARHHQRPLFTDDLVDFLRRCDCAVAVVNPGVLDVEARELPIDPLLRRPELELDAYLGIWSALRCANASRID